MTAKKAAGLRVSTKRSGRPRDRSTDDAILRAAMDVFIAQGIEGASIDRIARRARVARTTIYRRWSSGEALLFQAIEHARDRSARSGLQDLEPGELVTWGVNAGVELLTRPRFRKLAASLSGCLPNHPSLMSAYQKHVVLPRRSAFRKVLERARQQGVLPPGADLDVVIDMLSGVMVYRLLFQPEERDLKKVRQYLSKLFQHVGFDVPDTVPARKRKSP